MKFRYLLIILFLLPLFFIWPHNAEAFMTSTLCSGPWLGGEMIPDNFFPNKQFICPFDQAGTGLSYSCQEDNLGALSCFLIANPAQLYNCAGFEQPLNMAGSIFTGCASVGDNLAPVNVSFSASGVSTQAVNIAWNSTTDNVGVVSYVIERFNGAGNPYLTLGTVINTGASSYVFTDGPSAISPATFFSSRTLTPSTTYYYGVAALDAAGNRSGWLTMKTGTTLSDSTPPSISTGLVATAQSSSQINLSWTASTDNIGVTGYRVYRNGAIIAPNITATAYSDAGLTPSTAYAYTVEAYDAALNYSGQSASVSATTLAVPDTTSPSVPANLSASAVSAYQVDLAWTASTDTGGSGLAGYRIYRDGTQAGIVAASVVSYQDIGRAPSTPYNYYITAYDGVGNVSAQSNTVSATTAALPDTTPPTFTFMSPSNLLPVGTQSTNLSGSASESALCRYSDLSGQSFDSMTAMNPVILGMNFTVEISVNDGRSYSYYVKCKDGAGNVSNDFPIFFSVDSLVADFAPPAISEGQPATGTALPAGTNSVTMSVRTDKAAYCAFSKNTDAVFGAMTAVGNTLTTDLAKTYHAINLTGLVNGTSYLYYIRCQGDNNGVANDSGYPISFSIKTPSNNLPAADFTAAPMSGEPGVAVTVDGSLSHDSDGTIAKYVWQWGDGTPDASGSTASHTYALAGTYVLKLTITDNQNGVGTAQKTITVTALTPPPPPPPASNFCAATCDDNTDCATPDHPNMVCAPNGICALPAGFCTPGAVGVCSNGKDCPTGDNPDTPATEQAGICPAPVIKKGYFTLPTSKTEYSSPASFSAGTTDLIMNIETDVKAQCRYSATPSTDVNFYNNTEFMKDFTYSGATSSSMALTVSKNTAATTKNYYIRCKDSQTGDMNTADYLMSFTVSAQTIVSGPDGYLCWINQNFIKRGIPYLFDICRANDKCIPTSCSAPDPACGTTTTGTNNCGNTCSKTGPVCNTHSYSWKTSCSASCGGGTLSVWCERDDGVNMGSDSSGAYCNLPTRPVDGSVCNASPCTTYIWQTGSWSCSTSCGPGTQTRSVWCEDSHGNTVVDSQCSGPSPSTSEPCTGTSCTQSFYGGVHTEADCVSQLGTVFDDGTYKFCKLNSACPAGWTQYSDWSATSVNACSDCGACRTGSHTWSAIPREECTYGTGSSCVATQCFASIDNMGCY